MELKHKQVEVYNPKYEGNIEVDEGMAELLILLWDMDILTTASCQENEPGIMWINMPSGGASVFMTALSFKRDDELNTDSHSLYRNMRMWSHDGDNWKYHVHPRDMAESYSFDQEGFDADEDGFEDDFISSTIEGASIIYFDIHISFPTSDYPIIIQRLKEYKIQVDKQNKVDDNEFLIAH